MVLGKTNLVLPGKATLCAFADFGVDHRRADFVMVHSRVRQFKMVLLYGCHGGPPPLRRRNSRSTGVAPPRLSPRFRRHMEPEAEAEAALRSEPQWE